MSKKLKAAIAGLAFVAGCEVGIALQLVRMIRDYTIREAASKEDTAGESANKEEAASSDTGNSDTDNLDTVEDTAWVPAEGAETEPKVCTV
jgi:hypothetical protein